MTKHKITVLPFEKIVYAGHGETLLDVLQKNGYAVSAPCGGQGTCGKCKVQVLFDGRGDAMQTVYACRTRVEADVTVILAADKGSGLEEFERIDAEGEQDGLSVALDIGTTTLAACLVDLRSGSVLKKTSCLNPQSGFGADVLSRIRAAQDGKLALLQKVILEKTEEILQELSQGQAIRELVVAANTTMLHLFLGVNPKSIGVAPFTPVFTEAQYRTGASLGLSVERVRLLPSVSGYIGSDVASGVFACGASKRHGVALFVDIGTNGEIVLCNRGKVYATSAAAGPALEGACIECGTGGVAGAMDRVRFQNGELSFSTIGGAPPIGICGSGLIDLIAVLLAEGLIDEGGAWNDECDSPLRRQRRGDRFYVTESVYISQMDVRRFQLAKAAIAAGIETLLYESKVRIEEVEALYVAGGLGYYLQPYSAGAVGLLPRKLLPRIRLVGNTSLQGAALCAVKQTAQTEIEDICKSAETVELSFSQYFRDAYVDNMSFCSPLDGCL